jgi:hypothetical protein
MKNNEKPPMIGSLMFSTTIFALSASSATCQGIELIVPASTTAVALMSVTFIVIAITMVTVAVVVISFAIVIAVSVMSLIVLAIVAVAIAVMSGVTVTSTSLHLYTLISTYKQYDQCDSSDKHDDVLHFVFDVVI